jgi:hypothetical protein
MLCSRLRVPFCLPVIVLKISFYWLRTDHTIDAMNGVGQYCFLHFVEYSEYKRKKFGQNYIIFMPYAFIFLACAFLIVPTIL